MTGDDAEREELRRAFAATSREAEPRPDCPPPDRLWAGVRGELPATDARAVVAHTAECACCAEDWRVLAALAVDEPSVRAGRRGWFAALAAAAVLVLGVGLALWWPRPPPVYRDGQVALPVVRSLMSEADALPRGALVLRWSPGPPGARYDVEVAGEELDVVHRAQGLVSPELRVPAAALAGVPPGGKLLWRVEVTLPDGSRLSSPTFVNRVE